MGVYQKQRKRRVHRWREQPGLRSGEEVARPESRGDVEENHKGKSQIRRSVTGLGRDMWVGSARKTSLKIKVAKRSDTKNEGSRGVEGSHPQRPI